MPLFTYDSTGRGFSSAGDHTVQQDGAQHATVPAVSGSFMHGPSWTWHGAFGPEWSLQAMRSDRVYELRLTTGKLLATLRRGFGSSAMEVVTSDGERATVAARRIMSREHHVALSGGTAVITRTSPWSLMRREQWTLAFEEGVATGEMYTALLALPITIDHHRRRQRNGGTGGGGA